MGQKQGISHGDIKLADVVLFKANNRITYKLIDFGFSLNLSEIDLGKTETDEKIKEFRIKGLTPNYAAPELLNIFSQNFKSDRLVALFKMDVYAVGVFTLFLMGLKHDKIKEIKKKVKLLLRYQEEYPNSIKIIEKALINDSEERFSYEKLINLIKHMEKKEPDDNFFLSRYHENRLKSMSEEDLEKYVNLYIRLENWELAQKFAIPALEKSDADNVRKRANWFEKLGKIEFKMKNLKKSLENYNEAIKLLNDSDDLADFERIEALHLEKKKNYYSIKKQL